MTQSNKDEIYKKWAPILENIGLTGSKATNEDVNGFNRRCQQIHDNLEIISETSYYLERGKF